MKTAYGISRTRDKKGVIIKRDLREFVNCIHTMAGAGWETMEILVFVVYETKIIPIAKIWKSEANGWVYHSVGVSPAICCGAHSGVQPKINDNMAKIYRIRKLTPRECFRLMGVSDLDIDKIQAYPFHELIEHPSYSKEEILAGMTEKEKKAKMKERISESQQYKLAGNSIVVSVLEGIFTQMFRSDSDTLF